VRSRPSRSSSSRSPAHLSPPGHLDLRSRSPCRLSSAPLEEAVSYAAFVRGVTKRADFTRHEASRKLKPMWSVSVEAHESTPTLVRVARPLACSVALHLGLLTILVFAGSAALPLPPAARVAWPALEPSAIAPPPGAVPLWA